MSSSGPGASAQELRKLVLSVKPRARALDSDWGGDPAPSQHLHESIGCDSPVLTLEKCHLGAQLPSASLAQSVSRGHTSEVEGGGSPLTPARSPTTAPTR